jgi:hypothetical protein
MKLPIQALGLIPATLAALLVDFDAARGDDPKVLDLRNLEAATKKEATTPPTSTSNSIKTLAAPQQRIFTVRKETYGLNTML